MASRKPARLPRSLRKGALPRTPADVWAAGLGALGESADRGRGRFDALVARGRRVQAEGGRAVREAIGRVEQAAARVADPTAAEADTDGVERTVEAVLSTAGLPERRDVDALHARIHGLHARLAALAGAPVQPASVAVEVHAAGWAVCLGGRPGPASVHATKKEALGAGRRLARAHAPSRLVVHRADGSAGETVVYEA